MDPILFTGAEALLVYLFDILGHPGFISVSCGSEFLSHRVHDVEGVFPFLCCMEHLLLLACEIGVWKS